MATEPRTPAEYRAVWDAKPALRSVYRDYYARMARWTAPGLLVEVGAGCGNLRDELPTDPLRTAHVATDLVAAPWLDAVVDAQALPFADGSVGTVAGVDVLHHVQLPIRFLREARRVLAPGGRVVLVEPAITPVSRVAFALLHPEPVDLRADPLADGVPDPARDPFDANQAVPTLLAGRDRHRLPALTGLTIVHHERLSLLAYPLSGGFRPRSFVPAGAVDRLLRVEERIPAPVKRVAAFRSLLVLEPT